MTKKQALTTILEAYRKGRIDMTECSRRQNNVHRVAREAYGVRRATLLAMWVEDLR